MVGRCEPGQVLTEAALSVCPQVHAEIPSRPLNTKRSIIAEASPSPNVGRPVSGWLNLGLAHWNLTACGALNIESGGSPTHSDPRGRARWALVKSGNKSVLAGIGHSAAPTSDPVGTLFPGLRAEPEEFFVRPEDQRIVDNGR